jgi:cytochrome c-type biogenesis protein CcmE
VKKQVKFAVGAGIILVTLFWLGWVGARESKTYYHTIAELSTLKGAQARQRMRVGGDVRPGSIVRLPGRVDFALQQEDKTLSVSYVGTDPLPDTFVDGAQALVEGRQMPDGRFVAEKVQAKCASKYESAPGQPKTGYGNSGYPNKKS